MTAATAARAVARATAPQSGSARFFMLLYCPRTRRSALTTLLALADEIDAGTHRQLDHALAHARLHWWRQEAQRFAVGAPEHPWLLAWRREGGPDVDLMPLIESAAIDLASVQLAGTTEQHLPNQLFVLAARILTPTQWTAQQERHLGELGRCVATLERLPEHSPERSVMPPALLQLLQAPGPLIQPELQPRLTPLLVWLALAARQAQRRCRRARRQSATISASRFDGFADNILAWRAARRAARGQFHLQEFRLDACQY